MIKVRKIKNITESLVPIMTDPSTTIYISPNQELTNVKIYNFESIKNFVSVEYDLSEIPQIREDRKTLFD